ncbi:hypothetical protein [Lysobacter capsici]|uniref:hypothetical protein n=1 Tax=Lysobacter capsici TaxID=435897 RepID=UPI00287BB23C|nr:hypothetical protein [Lysobacter capsici]WND78528.1 hypothetical protein RJ610_14545 [Lysobacter capsici]WND83723.1 hypothetical protein RJ609_14555 [Lysobacter capsici]
MNKIILLLAASGLSEREMHRGFDEIRGLNGYELIKEISDLRASIKQFSRAEEIYGAETYDLLPKSRSADKLIGSQVAQMLRDDTGLTTVKASGLLLDALKRHLSKEEVNSLPVFNKESFSSWVQKISLVVPASIILHEAAKIRGQFAHSAKSDWPLGER